MPRFLSGVTQKTEIYFVLNVSLSHMHMMGELFISMAVDESQEKVDPKLQYIASSNPVFFLSFFTRDAI
jgi:hypothetical protein